MSEWNEVTKHISASFPGVAILAAMELDVFSALDGKAKTSEQLAIELGASSRHLRILLRSLAATKLIDFDGQRFANSSVASTYLVKGKPNYRGGSHIVFSGLLNATLNTVETVRSGFPQALQDWTSMSKERLSLLLRGLNVGAKAHSRLLATSYDFSDYLRLLDVGGGGGGLAIGVCEVCEGLTAVVADLPNVARIGRELVLISEMNSRVEIIDHDVTTSPLEEQFDVAVLRNFILVLDPKSAKRAIENIWYSLHQGGKIFIIGAILNDDGLGPAGALAGNLFFLNAFEEGESYAEREYATWLEASGFVDVRRIPFAGGLDQSLITATKQN